MVKKVPVSRLIAPGRTTTTPVSSAMANCLQIRRNLKCQRMQRRKTKLRLNSVSISWLTQYPLYTRILLQLHTKIWQPLSIMQMPVGLEKKGRPFSGATCVCDFSAHPHKDYHNIASWMHGYSNLDWTKQWRNKLKTRRWTDTCSHTLLTRHNYWV